MSQAPPWQWAKDASSPSPEQAWDVACNKSTGEVYVGGSYNGNLSAFYGAGLSSSSGATDAFLAKYSSAGAVLWAFKISGPDAEEVKGVATDPYGNVYVTGDFKNTVDFDPSAATYTLSTFGGPANPSGFLAKYNSSGALLWAVRFGNTQPSEGYEVFADANGVYITGDYNATATFYSTNAVTKNTAAGQQQLNAFGAKYDASGVVQWVVSSGSVKDDIGYNIIADNNNVYMIGTNLHDMSVYDASGAQVATNQINSPNKSDVFILAYQQSGAFLWASNVASNDDDVGSGLTQDAGNIYVSGSIKNTASFPYPSPAFTKTCQGGLDIFLAKLSKSTGVFQWVSSQTGSGNNNEASYELDTWLGSSIVMTGYFDNSLNYSAFGGPTLSTSGNEDIFVSSFDPASGNFNWAVKAGANGKDEPYGLSTDSIGDIYIGGEHAQNTVFGSYVITSGAGTNIFVAKMGCNPVSNNTAASSQTICTGNTPSSLSGTTPLGGSSSYVYTWQQSSNGTTWSNATGTYTNQNYAPPPLSSSMYYRRYTASSNGCGVSSTSSSLLISVDAQPTTANAGSNQTICATGSTLNANTPTTGSGLWSVSAGTGTVSSTSSPTTGVGNLSAGANKFVWTISNGVCPASSSTVTVTRDALPTTANAGTNQVLCTATSTLNANTPSIGTGSWTVTGGTGTVTTTSSPTSPVGSLSTGTNTLVWTITNGVCPASSSTVTITRDALPTTANAGASQTVCATGSTLNGNTPTTGSGLWSVSAGTGTVTTTNSPTSAVGNLSVGANKFVWTISNGTCPASSSTVTVARDALPTTANAGTNQVLCTATSTLNANTPSIGTGSWTVTGGTGTVTTTSSPTSPVGSLSTGTNTLVWTITNGVCPASSSTVNITRDALPTTANAGASQTVCATGSTLNANAPSTGSGLWSVSAGTGTVTTTNSPTSAVGNLSVGGNQFVWTISNGTCPASSSTVTVTRDALPTTANAGTNQVLCTATSTLNANTPSIGTGSWTVTGGTGTVTTTSSPTSPVGSLSTGTNTLVWTITNGVCPASSSTVTITRDDLPTTANAGASQTVCATGSTLNANTPTSGSGLWSVSAGTGTVTTTNSPTSAVGNLSVGGNQFVWTISNGTCPSSSSTITVTRDALPSTANAGASQTICAQSYTLAANTPTVGTAAWSVLSGGGSVSTPGNPSSPANNLGVGANDLVWTISNGVCPASSSTVTITRDALPTTANAGSDQTICSGGATLNANAPSTGSGLWTAIAGTGTVTTTSSPTSAVGNLAVGANQFVWSISNGVCPASQDTVSVTRDAAPSIANAGTSQTLCAQAYTLSANTPTIGTASWSVLSGGGNIANNSLPASAVNNLSPGDNAFVWAISNGVCPDSKDTVVITRDAQPTPAFAGNDKTICGQASGFNANTPSVGTGAWSLISGNGAVTSPASANSTVTGLGIGTNVFAWTISNGSCLPSSDTVQITSDALPSTAIAGPDQGICAPNGSLTANVPSVGSGLWTVVSGNGVISSPSLANSPVTGLSAGTNIFAWSISNGICPVSSDTIVIRRDLQPTAAAAGNDQTICSYTTTLDGNTPAIGNGAWSLISGSGSFASNTAPQAQVSGLAAGNALFVWTISNGVCQSSQDTVTIHVDAPTGPANAGGDQAICSNATVLAGTPPLAGSGTWSIVSGAGNIANSSAANSPVGSLIVGTSVFRWTVSNGVCPSSYDDVSVRRDTMPDQAIAGPDQDLNIPAGHLAANTPTIGTGSWSIVSGSGNLDNGQDPATAFHDLGVGSNVFEWTVSNGACPASKDEVIIYLEPFRIPNAFSPNGDNINDLFVVPGMDYYDGVKCTIFDRWGGVVYENDNYKNDWGGTNKSNELLAEDTYYYILDVKPQMSYSGYVIIKRNK